MEGSIILWPRLVPSSRDNSDWRGIQYAHRGTEARLEEQMQNLFLLMTQQNNALEILQALAD
jgi:hypothetical protein